MISFSDDQIDKISDLSIDRFAVETASDVVSTQVQLGSETPEAFVRRIAVFCRGHGISDRALITSIVMTHCDAAHPFPAPEGVASALSRTGFSEGERASAYLAALNGTRRRVTLEELREMA